MARVTITTFSDPSGFSADPLTDLIRTRARQLIERALDTELSGLHARFSHETTPDGHARIVRHGHLPEREIMTGVGPVAAKVLRVRDRGPKAGKKWFTSSILLPYLRKPKSIVRTIKRDYVCVSSLPEAAAAMKLFAGWFEDHSESHLRSGHKIHSPREFRRVLYETA